MVDISEIAIGIACGAFLITQVHLWRVARRLIRKSDTSWARVEGFVTEKYQDLELKVKAQIQTELKDSQAGIETKIQDVKAKIESIKPDLQKQIKDLSEQEIEIDLDPIKADLNAVESRMQTNLATTVEAIKEAIKAQLLHAAGLERRRLQSALGPFQEGIDQAGRTIMQGIQGEYDPVALQLMKIMTTEISQEYREQNPGAAFLIDGGKVALAETMKRRGMLDGVGKQSSTKKDVKSNTPNPFE